MGCVRVALRNVNGRRDTLFYGQEVEKLERGEG
jgi:hypothetical protein